MPVLLQTTGSIQHGCFPYLFRYCHNISQNHQGGGPSKKNVGTGHCHKSRSLQKQNIISKVLMKKTNNWIDDSIGRIIQL